MAGVTLEVDSAQVREALAGLMRAGRDPTPALKNIGFAWVQSTRDRFIAQVSPSGSTWAPLNPAYAAAKRGPGILRELGMAGGLMGSIHHQVPDSRTLLVGTNKVQAAVHQFGATIRPVRARSLVFRLGGRLIFAGSVRVPARPFLGASTDDLSEALAIVADFVAARAVVQTVQATSGQLP